MGTGAATKERILQVALDVFARYGYEGARMENIASIVGINKASLYFHFKSKEDIFRELFQSITSKYSLKIKQIMIGTKDLSTKERLIAIYNQDLEYNWNNVEMDFWNRVYYSSPDIMREEIMKKTEETKNEYMTELTTVFKKGILQKDIQPMDPVKMAKTYYYLLICIGISTDIINKEEGFKDMANCFDIVWDGIRQRDN
jgi:AcrR family transcriptional regulator